MVKQENYLTNLRLNTKANVCDKMLKMNSINYSLKYIIKCCLIQPKILQLKDNHKIDR